MIKLLQLGNNKTEVTIGTITGKIIIFFSYETPVAGYDHKGSFKTEEKYSKTTTKHIREYFDSYHTEGPDTGRTVSQEYINSLVS
tara:strand:+ start:161 stop:415 length:255 start_codon:yes stop_codon:yes gene_type:complete